MTKKMKNTILLHTAACVVLMSVSLQQAQAIPVTTEVVLLADVSPSVDSVDFGLQRDGYEAAFRDAGVIDSIGTYGPIAVTLVYWSNFQSIAVPWTIISDAEESNAFADAVANSVRPGGAFGTFMANAMNFGASLYANNGFEGEHLVLDVSGDGSDTLNGIDNPIATNVQGAQG